MNQFPLNIPLEPFLIFTKNRADIRNIVFCRCRWHQRCNSSNSTTWPTPQNEHFVKIIMQVQTTTQQHLKKTSCLKIFFIYFLCRYSPVINLYCRISSWIFLKNSKWSPWNTQGSGGKWFMKKAWSRKSRVKLPLRGPLQFSLFSSTKGA